MGLYGLLLGALGVWRGTHLLNAEDGPWSMLVRLRRVAGSGVWGELLDCFYCLSLSIAIPFALVIGVNWKERLLLWPALSASAILLERVTGERDRGEPFYWEDREIKDGMLRQGEERSNPHD
jgi:hypothetical protein